MSRDSSVVATGVAGQQENQLPVVADFLADERDLQWICRPVQLQQRWEGSVSACHLTVRKLKLRARTSGAVCAYRMLHAIF